MSDPTRHPDAEALLAAVCADPDDDTPRLVYADWLEEHGDERWRARAAFIREQVRVAAGLPMPDEPKGRESADGLLFEHFKTWWIELPEWLRTDSRGPIGPKVITYHRGFYSSTKLYFDQWLAGRNETRLRTPLDTLTLHGPGYGEGQGDEVGSLPQLATVRHLTLWYGTLTPAVVVALAASPHSTRLRALDLLTLTISDDTIRALARAEGLHRLSGLRVGSSDEGSPAVAAVLEVGTALRGLTDLAFGDRGLGDDGLRRLAGAPGLARLRTLSVNDRTVTAEGVAALAGSPLAAGLRELRLTNCQVGDAGAAALADSPHLGGLTQLELKHAGLSRAARNRLKRRFPFVRF
jgi:uncharacterized protein (TIGR02996 family)